MFEYGKQVEEVTTFTDSHWAGWKETRKSFKRRRGDAWRTWLEIAYKKAEGHCKEQRRGRAVRSSIGASESKGIVSLLRDPVYERKPVLAIDANATEHILHRKGIGKL